MKLKKEKPIIYIIGGKAKNGKDTVASLIKDNYEKKGLKVINLQYSFYIKEYAKNISDWDGSEATKPRELLQVLGTDVIRKNIDQNFFIKKIIDDILVYSFFFDVITISDARYKIEFDMIKDKFDIIALNVIRDNFDNKLTYLEKHHLSEIDLDDYKGFDYIIKNDGSMDILKDKVDKIISEVK